MKTASSLIQILALSACFLAQVHGSFAMPGVRRAIQTMASVTVQSPAPAAECSSAEACV